ARRGVDRPAGERERRERRERRRRGRARARRRRAGASTADSRHAASPGRTGARAQDSRLHRAPAGRTRRARVRRQSRRRRRGCGRRRPASRPRTPRRGARPAGDLHGTVAGRRSAPELAAGRAAPERQSSRAVRQSARSRTETRTLSDFTGKLGLIVGVANKRSLSWAIAQATGSRGARLALTYQGRFEEHVNDLSQGLAQPPLVLPCDVSSDQDMTSVFAKIEEEFGGLDFLVHGVAFASREELSAPFSHTTREGFRLALDISAYSLIALTRGAAPLMEKRGGGSVLTLSYLGSERVFPNYNVMGVAKAALEASVRYLAADLGPRN